MANNLLETKLNIPPCRPDLVSRFRLAKQLDKGLAGKLIIVSAPAGFGKSTLVSSWAQQSRIPIAWLSLDEKDNDPARLLTYLITAIEKTKSGFGEEIQAVLQNSQTPQIDVLLTMLVSEITALDQLFTLVLDDIHLLSKQSIFDAIEFLIQHLPRKVTLIIIGRVDPAIPLSRLRVGGQLVEIRTNDLRFSEPEVEKFLNDLMKLELSSDDIAALETRTEGWIAGLQLAALSLQGRNDKHQFINTFSGSHHYIIDYLMEEVLSRQPKELRTFLGLTSILDIFCASLCNATLDIANSRQILQNLEEANLFLIPLDDQRNWYRYHHLFSDFLSQCLSEKDVEKIPDLHMRAAKWYEQTGMVSEAVTHALATENYEWAGQLVESHAEKLLEQSELASLMNLVNKLPEDQVRKKPWLCIYHAWALRLSGRPYDIVDRWLENADQALEEFKKSSIKVDDAAGKQRVLNEITNLTCHIKAIRAFQALFRENLSEVIDLAQQVYSCAQNNQACQPTEYFLRSSTAFALGWANRFSGNLKAADEAFSEATTLALKSGNIYTAVASQCRAAYSLIMGGKLRQAAKSLALATEIATQNDGKRLPVVGYAHVYLGGLHYEWNDLDSAEYILLEGINRCKRVGYFMDQVVGYVYLARVRDARSDLDGAQEAIHNAERVSQKMKGYLYVQRWVEDGQVRLWISQGDLKAIANWIQRSGLGIHDDFNFLRDIEHIILARALVALGRASPEKAFSHDALSLLSRLLELAEDASWTGKAIEILVLESMAYQQIGDDVSALKAIEKALILAEPEGFVRTFVDEKHRMVNLLCLASSRGTSHQYTRRLLDCLDSELKKRPMQKALGTISDQPELLTKRERDILKMLTTDLSGPEIADEMNIALTTLRFHTRNIYGKLEVKNRRSAVRRAKETHSV